MLGEPIETTYESTPISNTNDYLSKTFFRMFLGLLATAASAAYIYFSGKFEPLIMGNGFAYLAIAQIVVVILFSLGFRKFSANVVTALFFIYSVLTGVTFSVIFAVFEIGSIALTFLATALMFGTLAYIGKRTNKDLTKFGTILTVTLVIGLILSIINLFVLNSWFEIIIDWVVLLIFMGFTVYDMNKITRIHEAGVVDEEKLYVYGAMELYLDFINIFLRILSLFGKRRN